MIKKSIVINSEKESLIFLKNLKAGTQSVIRRDLE